MKKNKEMRESGCNVVTSCTPKSDGLRVTTGDNVTTRNVLKDMNENQDEMIEYVKIRIIKTPNVQEFIGIDGRFYKIKEGEILEIPKENAEPFLRNGYAIVYREKSN